MIVDIFARAYSREDARFFGSAIDSSARFLPSQVPSQPADLPPGLFSSARSPPSPPPLSRTIFQEISVQYGTAPIHRRAAYETHVRTRSRGQAETVNPETRRGRCALLSSLTGQRTPLARARARAPAPRGCHLLRHWHSEPVGETDRSRSDPFFPRLLLLLVLVFEQAPRGAARFFLRRFSSADRNRRAIVTIQLPACREPRLDLRASSHRTLRSRSGSRRMETSATGLIGLITDSGPRSLV